MTHVYHFKKILTEEKASCWESEEERKGAQHGSGVNVWGADGGGDLDIKDGNWVLRGGS